MSSATELKIDPEKDDDFSYKVKSVDKKQSEIHNIMFAMICVNLLCGVILIVIGTWIVIEKTDCRSITTVNVYWPAVLTIVAGVFLMITSCSDTLILYSSHSRDIRSFIMALIAVISFEFAAIITSAVKSGQLHEVNGALHENMLTSISTDYAEEHVRQYWDQLQGSYECCGVNNYTDWYMYGLDLPSSCHCEMASVFLGCVETVNSTLSYSTGCYEPFANFMQYYFEVVILVNALMIVFEIIAALASVCSGCRIFRQSVVASYVVTS